MEKKDIPHKELIKLCEAQELKIRIIKDQLKLVLQYINKDIYGGGKND